MKKKILIVDDDVRIRRTYERLFHIVGTALYDVLEAANAQEVADVLLHENIDMVLLDIRMPEMDGRKIVEIIQSLDPGMKIVVASVYPIEEQRRLIPHARDYFDKSRGPLELLQKVTEALV